MDITTDPKIPSSSDQAKPDYSSVYYDPPAVPWWFLLIFFLLLGGIRSVLPDSRQWILVVDLLGGLWCIYFCLWLRRLDRKSTALYWVFASVCLSLLIRALTPRIGNAESLLLDCLELTQSIAYVVGIYIIRAELERHYNQREDFSLSLGPIATFFFSFLYFQYHLNDISESRIRNREELGVSV